MVQAREPLAEAQPLPAAQQQLQLMWQQKPQRYVAAQAFLRAKAEQRHRSSMKGVQSTTLLSKGMVLSECRVVQRRGACTLVIAPVTPVVP